MVLAKFKFGDSNTVHHMHTLAGFKFSDFIKIRQIAKQKTLPKFPTIPVALFPGARESERSCTACTYSNYQ